MVAPTLSKDTEQPIKGIWQLRLRVLNTGGGGEHAPVVIAKNVFKRFFGIKLAIRNLMLFVD
jgi:hypothetical protein